MFIPRGIQRKFRRGEIAFSSESHGACVRRNTRAIVLHQHPSTQYALGCISAQDDILYFKTVAIPNIKAKAAQNYKMKVEKGNKTI